MYMKKYTNTNCCVCVYGFRTGQSVLAHPWEKLTLLSAVISCLLFFVVSFPAHVSSPFQKTNDLEKHKMWGITRSCLVLVTE